ncbi:CBO0543 family protein [Niallia circulans]|uniref:CBO0543 family protein n=1 Tax=Niallia circulans TaxID=1397 RepID=UPI00351828A0
MNPSQNQKIEDLKQLETEYTKEWFDYWLEYSSLNDWQFWIVLLLLILPLITLYNFIDKRKALLIGFYGYNVHVFFTYIDALGANNAYWFYPYKVFPLLASNFTLDVSLVPISYMFIFQWTLNYKKNYYFHMTFLSAAFAFIFKPLMSILNLFELDKGANYLHLFVGYIIVGLVSKWVTNLFVYFQNKVQK